MDTIEVIKKLHQTPLTVANMVFEPWPGIANNYVQYRRRAGGKIHYEVCRRGRDNVDVRLDDERSDILEKDELHRQLRQQAQNAGKFVVGKGQNLIIRHNNPVQCEGRVFDEIVFDVQGRLSDLFSAFEQILASTKDGDFNMQRKNVDEQNATVEELKKFGEECKTIKEKLGSQFSIFDVLKISRMEIRHSNMLAWLLDSNENHGLGGTVLDGMLKKIGHAFESEKLKTFSIYREQDNIDILLLSDTLNTVIAIENKIGAKEGVRKTKKSDDVESQLATYENVLKAKYPNYSRVLLFLTPNGDPPSKDTWTSISYGTLIDIVDANFRQVYKAFNSNKAILIKDYIKTIKKDVLMEVSKELVEICRKVYNENKAAVKAVLEYGMTNVGEIVEKKLKELAEDKEMGLTHLGRYKFRLASLDRVFQPRSNESCWWGEGAYCCWVEVDVGVNRSKVCCSIGVVNSSDDRLAASIKKLCPNFTKRGEDSKWIALPWNAKSKDGKTNNKNWKDFDESSAESIEDAVTYVVKQLCEKIKQLATKE